MGGKSPPLYHTWYNMLVRCSPDNADGYPDHAGRGITVCDRWQDPEHGSEIFLEDMGPKPGPEHTLDRIDNDGNYEPGNCRWATPEEQSRNRRNTKIKGEDVPGIFEQLRAGVLYRVIAEQFNCAINSIYYLAEKHKIVRVLGAYWSAKTHCKYGHSFSGDNLYTDPNGRRACRTCRRERCNAHRARKRQVTAVAA